MLLQRYFPAIFSADDFNPVFYCSAAFERCLNRYCSLAVIVRKRFKFQYGNFIYASQFLGLSFFLSDARFYLSCQHLLNTRLAFQFIRNINHSDHGISVSSIAFFYKCFCGTLGTIAGTAGTSCN